MHIFVYVYQINISAMKTLKQWDKIKSWRTPHIEYKFQLVSNKEKEECGVSEPRLVDRR